MFFILSLIISFSSLAAAHTADLAYSKKWLKLLHYKKGPLGAWESQADGRGFFLHPNGKHDPLAELQKSIELFGAAGSPKDEDAVCRFPARYKWLNQQLGRPWKADFGGCKKYVEFFSKVAAKKASIVFSSYYLSNPNSAFGHTFLRFSRFEDKEETEMLDYGINYAADARATDPLTYAWKGLFGGYAGKFSAVPYYYKVREYSDYEFRDLWSYELKLDFPQVLEMVDHVWELGQTEFDYFYFKENCSYHLLGLIEAVLPSKDLTDKYSLFTIPADTIRLLKQEGLIGEGRKRDSAYTRLLGRSEGLTGNALLRAKAVALDPGKTSAGLEGLPDKKEAAVLDAAIEAFDYYNAEKILSDEPKVKKLKHMILVARARNPVISKDLAPQWTKGDSPAEGHAPTRLALSHGYDGEEGQETRFEYRAALHDLLDPPQGSLREAQLEMGRVSAGLKQREFRDRALVLQELYLVSMKNYPAQNFWSNALSWEVELGARQIERPGCFDCPGGLISVSAGNSIVLDNKKTLLALLVNAQAEGHDHYKENYRAGLGPKLVLRFAPSERFLLGLSALHHTNFYGIKDLGADHDFESALELRNHVSQDISIFLKLGGRERGDLWSSSAELGLHYFL